MRKSLKNTKNMNRKLVFSFYVFDGWENNFANRVHFEYLKTYAPLFDSALFIINTDGEKADYIKGIEKKIISLGYLNAEFKVYKNSLLREALPFYEEVVKKMNTFDGLVTWGHNKGVASGYCSEKTLFNWLSVMYFGSMGLIDYAERSCFNNYYGGEKYFYGAPMVKASFVGKYGYCYSGAFFTMNPASIVKEMDKEGKEFPKLSNRSYVEEFPANLFEIGRSGSFRDAHIFEEYADLYSYTESDWADTFLLLFGSKTEVAADFEKLTNDIWKKLI